MNNNETQNSLESSKAISKQHSFFDKEAIQIKGEQPEERIRIAEILSKLGEFGRLHKLILISTTLLNIALAGIVLTFPFLLHDPSFECVKDGLKFNCNQETACRKDVESTMHYTIHSLVVEYEAYCEGRWLKINGQIIIFVCSSIIATLTMFLMKWSVFLLINICTFLI